MKPGRKGPWQADRLKKNEPEDEEEEEDEDEEEEEDENKWLPCNDVCGVHVCA